MNPTDIIYPTHLVPAQSKSDTLGSSTTSCESIIQKIQLLNQPSPQITDQSPNHPKTHNHFVLFKVGERIGEPQRIKSADAFFDHRMSISIGYTEYTSFDRNPMVFEIINTFHPAQSDPEPSIL